MFGVVEAVLANQKFFRKRERERESERDRERERENKNVFSHGSGAPSIFWVRGIREV